MADTAKRLALGTIATTETTLYTVPSLTTTIVRNIRIINSTSSAVTVVASIGADALATRIIPSGYSIPANGTYDWSGFLVLTAAETLRATAGTTTALTAVVSGVEVT